MSSKTKITATKEGATRELVPKLRFSEFRGTKGWRESKLSDITTAIFDGTHQTPTYTDEGVPFYSVENLVSGNANKFISKADYELATKKNKPEKGDILITRIGKIGYSQVVTWSQDFSVYVTLAVIKQDKRFNSHFLHQFIQSELYQKEILSKSLLSAVPCKINMDSLRATHVFLAIPDEQQKIAECLSSVDELLAAQARKVVALKTHKKGLMQQLFPREGETQPRLRFPEFQKAGEWVTEVLGQLASYENGKAYEQDITENGKYVVVNSRFISTDGVVRKYTNADYMIAKTGEVLMVLSDLPKGKALAKCYFVEADDRYAVNQRICRLKPTRIDGKFLYYILNRHPRLLAYDDGLSQTHLSKGGVTECPLCVAPQKAEQQRISTCLSSLDTLITVETQKLEALKTHKKGLMQQLFPSPEEVEA